MMPYLIQLVLAVTLLTTVVFSFQHCSQFEPLRIGAGELSYPTCFENLPPGALLDLTRYTNIVEVRYLAAEQLVIATSDYTGQDNIFQISLSLDGGKTPYNYPEDPSVPLMPGLLLSPRGIALSNAQIVVFAYANGYGGVIIHTSNSKLEWKIVKNQNFSGCEFVNGEFINSRWVLVGSCSGQWSVIETDTTFSMFKVLDQLPMESYGGSADHLIIASDQCLYVAGYNWSIDTVGNQTSALIQKSCDDGASWVQDFSFTIPNSANTSFSKLIEHEGQIFAIGNVDNTKLETSDLSFWNRLGENNWQGRKIAIEHEVYWMPIPISLVSFDSCHLIAVVRVGSRFDVQETIDCGQNWSLEQSFEPAHIRAVALFDNILYLASA